MARRYPTVRNPSVPVRIDVRPYPNKILFCANQTAWKKAIRDWDPPVLFSDKSKGAVASASEGRFIVIKITPFTAEEAVTIGELAAVVSHEAMHAVQEIKDYIEEKQMSAEAEAYLLDHIVKQVVIAWMDTNITPPDKGTQNEEPVAPVDVAPEGPTGQEELGSFDPSIDVSSRNVTIPLDPAPRKSSKRGDYDWSI